jgi:hypothetical protein
MTSRSLDELADESLADRTRQQFEPTVMAQDLAVTIELLSVAIEAIPADQLNLAEAGELIPLWTHPSNPCDGSDVISDAEPDREPFASHWSSAVP